MANHVNDTRQREFNLGIEQELRFVVGEEATGATLQLLSGFAEILGTEVIQNKVYTFRPSSSVSLFTWKGCNVKISGSLVSADVSADSLIMINVVMHACLEGRRVLAEYENAFGPISLVVGPTDVGKTSFCHMLLNYAARMGRRPVFIDLDVGQSSVSMPGSICVTPIETPSDVTDGFDQNALSVYHFGHKSPGHDIKLYFFLIQKLGQLTKNRMKNANSNTRSSGIIIDTCGWVRGHGYNAITLAACAFEIDVLFVLEEEKVYLQLKRDMPSSVEVVYVPKQRGVYERDRAVRAKNRDNRIWEYFYGPRGNLNPFKVEINFSDISVYTILKPPNETNVDAQSVTLDDINIVPVSIDPNLERCILGLSFAEEVDENFLLTGIIGFMCVVKADMDRKKVTMLTPQPGPLPGKICILGEMKLLIENSQPDSIKSES